MSYGQNLPWGLQAIKTTTGAIYNGQTEQYFIQSGYAFNIFRGDLVFLGSDGFIHNLAELGNVALANKQSFGVFNGCSFTVPTSVNAIDPSSPGRAFWPAGTVIPSGLYGTCDIIVDPSIVYNVQVDSSGLRWEDQGATASVAYTYISGNNPNGNTTTGQSSLVLAGATAGTDPLLNVRILRFVPDTTNPIPLPGAGPSPFVNVEVVIQNHSLVQRAPGL